MTRDLVGVHSNFPPVAEARVQLELEDHISVNWGHTGKSGNGVEVSGLSLAEDEGGGGVVRGGVGNGVGLASNNTLSREVVDLEGSDGGSEGRGGKDGLEEAHGDGSWIGD